MPAYIPMGSLTPALEWKLWSNTTDLEVFRITQIWNVGSWRPRGIITQVFDDDIVSPGIKIYAKEVTEDLVELPIPTAYKISGVTLRKIGFLMLPPYRRGVASTGNWQLYLEAYDPA